MNSKSLNYKVVVIGSGPAGQNAAIVAAQYGVSSLIIEREPEVGGACVQYGTIPSKTLRETAVTLTAFRRRSGGVYDISQDDDLQINSLMSRLDQVVSAHQSTTRRYLDDAGVDQVHGHAEFVSPNELLIQNNFGETTRVSAEYIVIATGSRPRQPPEIPVDHENILDSDSILSMTYLPRSMTIFGGGVIACEYASTFAALGVKIHLIDRGDAPLRFLESDLTDVILGRFRSESGEFHAGRQPTSVEWDGISSVRTVLDNGQVIETDKAMVALGRIANTDNLNLTASGLTVTERGLFAVNENFQTSIPSIYAVGDTVGPPALASTSMDQGRRAIMHALDIRESPGAGAVPIGIYTIPEISSVGMTEAQAIEQNGGALVGQVPFADLGRGQIMAARDGFLKLIADPSGERILGVQIVGDGATELIHVGQMAVANGTSVEILANTIFNFPTLAEAYRLAAIEIRSQLTAVEIPTSRSVPQHV